MSDTPPKERPSLDAIMVAKAVDNDWIMRGFKLGIGFWLAGIVAIVLLFFAFAAIVGQPTAP